MWTHLGHFLGAIFGVFFSAIGSTGLGKSADIVFVVLVSALSVRHAHRRGGWDEVKRFWDEEAKFTLRASLIAAACIYIPIALWSVGRATYEDHMGLVTRSHEQRKALQANAGILQQQKANDLEILNVCENQNARIGGQNDTLNRQNRDQQNTINNCQTQALKLLTPQVQKTTVLYLDEDHTQIPHVVRFILLTNKPVTPVDMNIQCNRMMDDARLEALETGRKELGTGPVRLARNEFTVNVIGPSWTPTGPFLATIKYEGESEGLECSFDLR